MHKPISEMAIYLQNLLPPEIPQTFEIDPLFLADATEADIYKGVPALKTFLHHLYSQLITDGGPFDKPKRESHNTNINSSYPFILHLTVILMNISLHGKFDNKKEALLLNESETLTAINSVSMQKIPDKRKNECIQFLTACGLHFDGLDISGKKPIKTPPGSPEHIIITYPKNPIMLTGLKVMATVQHNKGSKYNNEILLRCDWRTLTNNPTDSLLILKDLTHTLPANVRGFLLNLHAHYMSLHYKCDTYIGCDTRFEYFCRSKELWRYNLTLNNNHFITIKAQHTNKYPEIVSRLPERLQNNIKNGYGCGKKMGTTDSCDSGCRGYRVPLDDSFMEISDVVKAWIDREVEIIKK